MIFRRMKDSYAETPTRNAKLEPVTTAIRSVVFMCVCTCTLLTWVADCLRRRRNWKLLKCGIAPPCGIDKVQAHCQPRVRSEGHGRNHRHLLRTEQDDPRAARNDEERHGDRSAEELQRARTRGAAGVHLAIGRRFAGPRLLRMSR